MLLMPLTNANIHRVFFVRFAPSVFRIKNELSEFTKINEVASINSKDIYQLIETHRELKELRKTLTIPNFM